MADDAAPAIALRLIGSPRVTIDARPVTLGSRKALALLALLALDGASPRVRLAAVLWPDQDEADARRNLRREVFRLRNAGVPIDDDETQSLALTAAVACDALDAAAGAGLLLDGYEGLAGEAYDEWLLGWRARLTQRSRRFAAQAAAEHEARGDWRAALALHLAELDADATNESAAQHALRLYARLGERDAALALFARLESQLRLQLGLAPLPATRELVRQFDTGGAAAASALGANIAAAEAQQPLPIPARAPFAGRATECAAIQAAWQAGRTVFVAGPPGIGKSRLAAECAAAAGAALFVHCRPDDLQLAYSSAVRALRALLDAATDHEFPPWVARELTRLLPELGPPGDAGDGEPPGDEARLRLFEAYAQAWSLLAAGNFNVVVVDDWQYADAASLQVWSFVDARRSAAESAGHAVRRLYAYRSGELPATSLAHVRQQTDSGSAMLLALDGLRRDDVQSLVQRLAGQSGAGLFAQRLHGATDGNPLFVLETIRHLFESQLLSVDPAGGWRTPFDAITSDYAELPVPPSARDTLLARVHALGDDAARLLQAASLAGDSFDLPLLAGTTALDAAASVAVLERAQASQVLRVGDDGAYRFAHDLYRQCVADSLSPARRALVHGRLARNVEAAGGAAARIALHLQRAQLGREAAPWFVRAGADAERVFDLDGALAHYETALGLGLPPDDAYAARDSRLLILHRQHRTDEQLQELRLMAELAQQTDNPVAPYELAAKRAVALMNSGRLADAVPQARWVADNAPSRTLVVRGRYLLGTALMFLGDDENAVHELEAALAEAPVALPRWEPVICAFLCHLAVSAGALERARGFFDRGLRSAEAFDALSMSDVLNAGYRIAEATGDRPAAIAHLERANELSMGVGDVTLRIHYLFNLIVAQVNGGDVRAARVRRDEVMTLLAGKTDPKAVFIVELTAGRVAASEGQLGQAWRSMGAALAAAASTGDRSLKRSALVTRAHLAADCGDVALLDEMLGELGATGADPGGRIDWVDEALRARRALLAGDACAAVARLRPLFDAQTTRAPDPDRQENTELAQVTLALALAACGDTTAACEALPAPIFSQRLQAMAAEAGLAIGADDDAEAQSVAATAVERASELLASGRLSGLEAARLWRSLAAHYRRRHDPRSTEAIAACRRLVDELAGTLPLDDAATARLRTALSTLPLL